MINIQQRSQSRQLMREQRRKLSDVQQSKAAQNLARVLATHPGFLSSQKLAFYLAIDSEIDPSEIIQLAWQQEKHCYLPVLNPDGSKTLLFAEYTPETTLIRNFYGLSEPDLSTSATVSADELDLVLLPLVAFDLDGARLGMGGGYYDRSFEFLKELAVRKPVLTGLAHECQRVEKLELATWDIPLDEIITDQNVYRVKARNQ